MSIFSKVHSSGGGRRLYLRYRYHLPRYRDRMSTFRKSHLCHGSGLCHPHTARKKQLFHNKLVSAVELRNRCKGRTSFLRGGEQEAYLSHVKVQVIAARKDIYLVMIYGPSDHPMILAANKPVRSKEDVVKIARLYFASRQIEEYFRCKNRWFNSKTSVSDSWLPSTR